MIKKLYEIILSHVCHVHNILFSMKQDLLDSHIVTILNRKHTISGSIKIKYILLGDVNRSGVRTDGSVLIKYK